MSRKPVVRSNGKQCKVHKRGHKRRTLYDKNGVFNLVVQKYFCSSHEEWFNDISPHVVKMVSANHSPSTGLFVSPRLLFTTRLASYIFDSMPLVGFNFTRIKKLIMLNWSSETCASTISTWSIKNMYTAFWKEVVKPQWDSQIQQLCSTTGVVLRGDHTYKVVKNMSAFSETEKKRVSN